MHPGCTRFTSLRLNRKGTLLLASSLDKHARMFEVGARAAGDEGFTAQEAHKRIQSLLKARRAVFVHLYSASQPWSTLNSILHPTAVRHTPSGVPKPGPDTSGALLLGLTTLRQHQTDPEKLEAVQVPGRGSLLRPGAPLLRQVREFEDAVQRSAWSTAVFSHDSEHVATVSQARGL